MRLSLIVTTYNRPAALDRVLASVAACGDQPHDVVVADDGSRADTAAVVGRWRETLAPRLPGGLHHVWQPDAGFRAAAARNRAAACADGELLVFVDGDCLLRPDFFAQQRRLAEPGWMLAGNRVLATEALTARIESGAENPLAWGPGRWLRARLAGEVNRLDALLRLPDGAWRRRRPRRWEWVRTCNLAVWRADFERVNGFDETFDGWGFEDSDLAIRLINAGVGVKSGRYATALLHLWHRENPRGNAEANRARALQALQSGIIEAARGLRQRDAADVFAPPEPA